MRRLGATLAVALFASVAVADEACLAGDGAIVATVCYTDAGGPVGYGHDILGDTPEWTDLQLVPGPQAVAQGARPWVTRFKHGFFEDIQPRLADVTGDGLAEVIAVQTDLTLGARLLVLSAQGAVLGATSYAGQPHRWIAPAGIGDFDGDGRIEIAYVDRPHLARELVFVRLDRGLHEVGRFAGFSNHRIGDDQISGGLRRCAGKDSLILADARWQRVVDVSLREGRLIARDRGGADKAGFAAAMACG